MLKLADLAGRPDFDAGPLHVSPARRSIEGPAGRTTVEPIVMKVFLLLLDARGSVVTRDELFGNAWGGVFVGDDSLNRAIARVRKIATETAPGLFEIETTPRTGYRLTGEIVAEDAPLGRAREVHRGGGISRRALVGATAGVGLAGAAEPSPNSSPSMPRCSRLSNRRPSLDRTDHRVSPAAPASPTPAVAPTKARREIPLDAWTSRARPNGASSATISPVRR